MKIQTHIRPTCDTARVAFIDQTSKMGGAEHSLLDIAKRRLVDRCRDRVILFESGEFQRRLESFGVDTVVCALPSAASAVRRQSSIVRHVQSLQALRTLGKRVAANAVDFDVLYANTMKAFVAGAMASRRSGMPLIFHLRDIVSAEHFSRSNRLVIRAMCRVAKRIHVIANSSATADAMHELVRQRVPIDVIHNGIDSVDHEKAFRLRDEHRRRLRTELSLDSTSRVIGVFGRLSNWKGQHLAIQALEHLPECHLVIVGDALFGEEDYRESLRRRVAEDGLEKRVHFLGHRHDVPELMQTCDLALHTSIAAEPFGRVVVEAMFARCPVVAANAGGPAEIIQHGQTGWLYEPGNVDQMVHAIGVALDQDDDGISQRALIAATESFGIDKKVREVSALVKEVVGK
ncbi:MAG: glycosyltransferase [Planctomycetota bacterium]